MSEPGSQTPPGGQSSADVQQALLRSFVPYARVVSFIWACIRRIVPAVCTFALQSTSACWIRLDMQDRRILLLQDVQ